MPLALDIDRDRLADELCRRYHVSKLELFGSRAQGTARPDSDVDLLVTFEHDFSPGWELGGLSVDLHELLGRKVALITRWTLEHDESTTFRSSVHSALEPLYAA
jgi:predicted nucleotidyltransferase